MRQYVSMCTVQYEVCCTINGICMNCQTDNLVRCYRRISEVFMGLRVIKLRLWINATAAFVKLLARAAVPGFLTPASALPNVPLFLDCLTNVSIHFIVL